MNQDPLDQPKPLTPAHNDALPARPVNVTFREPYKTEYPEDRSEGGLHEYWTIVRRHKFAVFLAVLLGALAGYLFTVPQMPIYQAHTTVEVRPLNENFLNIRDVNPDSPAFTDPTGDILTQVQILESKSLRQRAVQKLLDKKPESFTYPKDRLGEWKAAAGLGVQAPVTWEQAVGMAAGGVSVRASGNTRILDVACESADPGIAADFANTLVSEFIDQSMEARINSTALTSEWLTRQIEELKIKLEKSEDQLQAYATAVGLQLAGEAVGTKDGKQEDVAESKLRELQGEMLKAQSDRVAAQSKYELASSVPADSLPQVLDDASLREYQTRLTELRRQMAELGTSLTAANPKVIRVQAQINEIENSLGKERGNVVSRIRNEYEESQRRERMITAEYDKQFKFVTDQAGKTIHYNILKREVDTNRQVYEAMLQKVKEASIATAIRASGYRVIDPATPPGAPYKPNPTRAATMGAMFGTVLGIALVLIRERADRSLQQPGDLTTYLNLPELGVIPSTRALAANQRYGYGETAFYSQHTRSKRKTNLLAESFQAVLTSILFSPGNGTPPQVLVITSASPAEGKSLTSSNLARALAEINQRVVLVDADMRKPRQHEAFGLSNDHGLSDVLRQPVNQVDMTMLRPTEVPGLSVLTSGAPATNASNLLHSPRLGELISRLRCEFDTIIIDTPPMLHLADARVLGRHCDGVILVVRAGRTTRDAAIAAQRKFCEDGTPILGTILNDWNPGSGGYGYGYYTGYKYYRHKQK